MKRTRHRSATRLSGEHARFIGRRVQGFLDPMGLQTRTVEHLMCEAYLQGVKDAVQAMTEPETVETKTPPIAGGTKDQDLPNQIDIKSPSPHAG